MKRFRVVADTTLGVSSHVVESSGKGVLVLERFREAFAKAEGIEPAEVELLSIEDMSTNTLVWEASVFVPPTAEEIRASQEEGIADVERQLAEGRETILVGKGELEREVSREAAWAVITGMKKAHELDARYDGVEAIEDGSWLARVHVPIGRFEA